MWPTPTATPYGSSQNGINGVGGEFERPSANKPSLEKMARMQAEIVPMRAPDWPTPMGSDGTRSSGVYARGNPTLVGSARAWPTPVVSGIHGPRAADGRRGVGLNTRAEQWPTPKSSDGTTGSSSMGGLRDGDRSMPLPTAASRWPTPTSTDAKASGTAGTTLTDAAVRQWATPAARDWKDGACVEANVPTKALLGRQAVRWATPASATSGLLDPTTSMDGEPTSPPGAPSPPSSERRVLNPRFVEALMGLPPSWVSALPRTTAARGPASSDDPISYESWATASSGNRPPLPSSIYDDEPLEDDDVDGPTEDDLDEG